MLTFSPSIGSEPGLYQFLSQMGQLALWATLASTLLYFWSAWRLAGGHWEQAGGRLPVRFLPPAVEVGVIPWVMNKLYDKRGYAATLMSLVMKRAASAKIQQLNSRSKRRVVCLHNVPEYADGLTEVEKQTHQRLFYGYQEPLSYVALATDPVLLAGVEHERVASDAAAKFVVHHLRPWQKGMGLTVLLQILLAFLLQSPLNLVLGVLVYVFLFLGYFILFWSAWDEDNALARWLTIVSAKLPAVLALFATVYSGLYVWKAIYTETGYLGGMVIPVCLLTPLLMYLPMIQLTPEGYRARYELLGLKAYMTAESRVLPGEPACTLEHYEDLLPYAIGLGVEKQWTQRFYQSAGDRVSVSLSRLPYLPDGSLTYAAFAWTFVRRWVQLIRNTDYRSPYHRRHW